MQKEPTETVRQRCPQPWAIPLAVLLVGIVVSASAFFGLRALDRHAAQRLTDASNHWPLTLCVVGIGLTVLLAGLTVKLTGQHEELEHRVRDRTRSLQESEQQLRTILDNVQAGVIIIDRQTRQIVEANPTAVAMIGRSQDEVLGKVCHQFVCPAERNSCPVLDGGQEVDSSERVLLTADGGRRSILKTVVPITLGGRDCLLESLIDITARQQAEQALRDREEWLTTVVNASAEAIIAIDESGTIALFNRAAERIFRRRAKDVIGRPLDILVPDDLREEHQKYVRGYFATGKPNGAVGQTVELRGARSDGEQFPLELSLSVGHTSNGRFALAVLRDITERKRTEMELKEALDQLHKTTSLQQAIFNSTEYSIIATQADGTITVFNTGAERMLGYHAEEVVGKVTPKIIHDTTEMIERAQALTAELGFSVEPGFEAFVAKARLGQTDEREWTYIRKDGTRFPVLLSVSLMCDDTNQVTGFVGIAKDITERKKAIQQLQEYAQKLTQANRALENANVAAQAASEAKGQFLANMSHELRTPLNGVIGMTELLRGTALDDRQRRFIDACHSSAASLLGIINDILDFSKIEAGKLDLEVHEFDLQEVVNDTVAMLAQPAHGKKLELNCFVAPDVRCRVLGDSVRFRQVIANLLNNAVKFTSQGEITVRAVPEESDDETITVHCTVADTGIGVPPNRRDRLFQSFSQLDRSTTRIYGGTGLGLAICKSLAEAMGGQIGVESTKGRGSLFWFTARFQRAIPGRASPSAPPPALHHIRVLVVESNDTNRAILVEMLQGWGMDVAASASWDEATARLAIDQPDLCVASVPIADDRRLELAERLAAAAEPLPTRLFLLASLSDPTVAHIESLAGVDRRLPKPASASTLLDAIVDTFCGGWASSSTVDSDPGLPKPAEPKPVSMQARILLAEDNNINRMYAEELLRNGGYEFTSVANGREAIEELRRGRYDLVLMDCQMPEMDGFEAARSIRELERSGELPRHLPIVALTANAVKGDRQRCLDAGMDDYVSKPIDTGELTATMRRLLGDKEPLSRGPSNGEAVSAVDHPLDSPPIDQEALMARCLGKLDFVISLLDEAETGWPAQVEKIDSAVKAADAHATAEAAHSLKGAAGILAASKLREIAAELEAAGRGDNLEDAARLVSELRDELRRCLDQTARIRANIGAS